MKDITSNYDDCVCGRYFTWDAHKFPHSVEMINNVSAVGRKMVTIVDPHIKKDNNFGVYKQGRDLDYFIKDSNGNEYEGWCWPGERARASAGQVRERGLVLAR